MNTLVNNFAVSELPSLLTIENGEKVSATFSLSEYQNRQSKQEKRISIRFILINHFILFVDI